jgi:hypothetical protein
MVQSDGFDPIAPHAFNDVRRLLNGSRLRTTNESPSAAWSGKLPAR